MTPQEIKERVDFLYNEIGEILSTGTFVLAPRIREIYDELDVIEQKCQHEYDESGECIYCYHLKEDN